VNGLTFPSSFLIAVTVGGGEDSMDGPSVDLGETAAYREMAGCEDGGGVIVPCDMEGSLAWKVEDGAAITEIEVDMARGMS